MIEYWPGYQGDEDAQHNADLAWHTTWNLLGEPTISPYHPELTGSQLWDEVPQRRVILYKRTEGDVQAEIKSADFATFLTYFCRSK
jgi:hypothetical protein